MPMNPRLLRPLARRQAPSAFSPDSITGLVAWYDASDAATLFQNSDGTTAAGDADPVGYWEDKAGANNLTQPVNNNRPTLAAAAQNGKAAVTFDGADDFLEKAGLNLTNASEFSLFAVIKYADPEGGFQIPVAFPGVDGSGSPSYAGATLEINRSSTAAGAVVGSITEFTDTNAYSSSAASASAFSHGSVFDEPTLTVFVNGASGGTTTLSYPANNNGGFRLGSYAGNILNAACDICEVVYYSRAITSSEIASLQSYFAAKWGL